MREYTKREVKQAFHESTGIKIIGIRVLKRIIREANDPNCHTFPELDPLENALKLWYRRRGVRWAGKNPDPLVG